MRYPGALFGTRVGERFVLEHEAGRGGMGVVYAARDELSGRRVAVKIVTPETVDDVARFLREAKILESLHAPGIVEYVAHGQTDQGTPFLAMEWLEGEDLATRLTRGVLGAEAALDLLEPAIRALAVAHENKLVHRDIKPSNLFLVGGAEPTVKLLDFGIARLLTPAMTLTAPGAAMGTPQYMAPEQWRGERTIDARADVFALGCVLFECIAGSPAYEGEHPLVVFTSILLHDAPRLATRAPGVPPGLDSLVARMMARDRSMRPVDASALLIELAGLRRRWDRRQVTSMPPLAEALSGSERRFVSLVVARRVTMAGEMLPALDDLALRERVESLGLDHGVAVEIRGAETVLAVIDHAGTAREQASRAVRFALVLGAELGDAIVCVVSGHAVMHGALPTSDLVDRAVALANAPRGTAAGEAPEATARVDTFTANLLDGAFDMTPDAHGAVVRGERAVLDSERLVLRARGAFIGREREMALLEATLAAAAEGELRAVLVTAPPGFGKSRFTSEVVARATRRGGVRIACVGTDSTSAGSPLRLLAALVGELAGIASRAVATASYGDTARDAIATLVAKAFANDSPKTAEAVLGKLVGATPSADSDAILSAARADPVLFVDLVRRFVRDLFAFEARRAPLVLVLEDLHWGDLPSIDVLESVAAPLRDHPIVLVGTARPEVEERFAALWSSLHAERLDLGPLPRRSAERLVRDLLGDRGNDAIVRAILHRAEGSPLFLEELARAAATGDTGELPMSVLATLQARLDKLGEGARRALTAASVFGERFWPGGIAAVLGVVDDDGALIRTLDELLTREVLLDRPSSKPASEREFAFQSALLRDAAYALWSESDRSIAHLCAGRWLEQAGEKDPVVLAWHLTKGGAVDDAAHLWLASATRALGGGDLDLALDFVGRARAGAGPSLAAPLDLIEAEVHYHRKDLKSAAQQAAAALGSAPYGGEAWLRAASTLIAAAGQRGDNETVLRVARDLVLVPIAPDERVNLLAIAIARAMVQLTTSPDRAAYHRVRARLDELTSDGPRLPAHVRAHVARARGTDAILRRRLDEVPACLEECIDAYEAASDLRGSASARTALASACMWLGETERAEAAARHAIVDATRAGSTYMRDWARYALGKILVENGDYEAGLAEHLHVAAVVTDSPRIVAGAHLHASLALSAIGRPADAENEARRALELSKTPAIQAGAMAALSRALLGLSRKGEALESSREAFTILANADSFEEFETLVRAAHAEALEATGHREEARTVVEHARQLLLAAAEAMPPGRRESFLTRPRETVRLMRWAREWLDRGGQ